MEISNNYGPNMVLKMKENRERVGSFDALKNVFHINA